MAQAKLIDIMLRPGCGQISINMEPAVGENCVYLECVGQLFTPTELRTLARLLEQTADRKEGLFTVVSAT